MRLRWMIFRAPEQPAHPRENAMRRGAARLFEISTASLSVLLPAIDGRVRRASAVKKRMRRMQILAAYTVDPSVYCVPI
jgi:hypothetical protein